MCTIAIAFQAHPRYPLVLASNRDEFYERPSLAADFWRENPHVLGGRDLQGGGTWMGVTRAGRFGVLTNIRTAFQPPQDAPSRGKIVSDFLNGGGAPAAFIEALAKRAASYDGFNLLAGDLDELFYFSNRGDGPRRLEPGVYGLSNSLLDFSLPKAERASLLLKGILESDRMSPEALLEMLADVDPPHDATLPQDSDYHREPGQETDWERELSTIFVRTPEYGTCASTVFIVDGEDRARYVERRAVPGDDGGARPDRSFEFMLEVP